MQFVTNDRSQAARVIATRLTETLQADRRVLWLVSGGSNVGVEVAVMQQLQARMGNELAQLIILPMDERYGPPGHENSNTEQLRRAGFEAGNATWVDILASDAPFEKTVSFYSEIAADMFAQAQVVIGQFGLGTDGHVAGIKPDSPACSGDSATVVGYEWSDYTRLTLSVTALRQISVAYVPAYGADKGPVIKQLQKNNQSFTKFPAKLLYDIPEVYVYTDVFDIGEAGGTRR